MSESKSTTDHTKIKQWAEARGGKPATVEGTGSKSDAGILRIMFPDAPHSHHDSLKEVSWDEFFQKFDKEKLCLVYQDETHGEKSNFHKIVSR